MLDGNSAGEFPAEYSEDPADLTGQENLICRTVTGEYRQQKEQTDVDGGVDERARTRRHPRRSERTYTPYSSVGDTADQDRRVLGPLAKTSRTRRHQSVPRRHLVNNLLRRLHVFLFHRLRSFLYHHLLNRVGIIRVFVSLLFPVVRLVTARRRRWQIFLRSLRLPRRFHRMWINWLLLDLLVLHEHSEQVFLADPRSNTRG